ncbi:MAG TPA: AAA family ATPase [Ktedonobacterales bacterium]
MARQGQPRLLLICGLPGAGKTTLAQRLAAEVPAIRLCPDEWMAHLGIDLYDEPARERLERMFWLHAQDLLHLGVSVILESGFWLRSDRDEKRLGAHALGAAVELYYLDVPLDERWRRIEQRNAEGGWGSVPITRAQLASWDAFFEVPAQDELALFDAPMSGRQA